MTEAWLMFIDVLAVSWPILFLFLSLSFLFGLTSGAIVGAVTRSWSKGLGTVSLVFVFAFIATITGYVTGNSRTTVTGDVLPVLLTGLGALFVLGFVNSRVDTSLAGTAIFSFTACLFLSIVVGSLNRETDERRAHQEAEKSYEMALRKLEEVLTIGAKKTADNLAEATNPEDPEEPLLASPSVNCTDDMSAKDRLLAGCSAGLTIVIDDGQPTIPQFMPREENFGLPRFDQFGPIGEGFSLNVFPRPQTEFILDMD
jgi:hypothetical protein